MLRAFLYNPQTYSKLVYIKTKGKYARKQGDLFSARWYAVRPKSGASWGQMQ